MVISDTLPGNKQFDARKELLMLLRTFTTPMHISSLLSIIEQAGYSRAQKYNLITKLSYNLRNLQKEHIIEIQNEQIYLQADRFSLELQAYNIY